MKKTISREELERIKKIRGEIRGVILKTDISFITRKSGKGSLEKIESRMKQLGYPFKYSEIKLLKFYPIRLRVISLLVMKEVLGFSDEQIREMGAQVPKDFFVLRLSMSLLGFAKDPKKLYENAPGVWKKFITIGEFIVPKFEEKAGRGRVIDRIKDFKIHPILCTYLLGILAHFHEIARRVERVDVQELKCPFKGDEYHEFLMRW